MSLQSQLELNWEALIGVDIKKAPKYNTPDLIQKRQLHFIQDKRLHWIPIDVSSNNRGKRGNGSGDVRNAIIRHASADWVAFVDDDDLLSPMYTTLLLDGRQLHQEMGIYLFRMMGNKILPPYSHGLVASGNNVGISFAVRKDIFVHGNQSISFDPGSMEDYYFLRKAQAHNVTIKLSCNVTYFVRQPPKLVKPSDSCRVGDAIIK